MNNLFLAWACITPHSRYGSMPLDIASEEGTVVVAIPRRFDTDTTPKIEEELRPVLEGRPQALLLDFTGTDYISSAGMRAVRGIQRAVTEAGGIFAISSLNHHVSYVFEITGFTRVFTIYSDKAKALRKMKKAR